MQRPRKEYSPSVSVLEAIPIQAGLGEFPILSGIICCRVNPRRLVLILMLYDTKKIGGKLKRSKMALIRLPPRVKQIVQGWLKIAAEAAAINITVIKLNHSVISFILFNSVSYTNTRCFFLIISFCLSTSTAEGRQNCFSFLPHGYNDFFVHLPKSERFCVETPDGIVNYRTNQHGARIIKGDFSETPIYAFGESQLVEIFPRDGDVKHALWEVYGKHTLFLHGAPNNGPNETLEYIRYVARQSAGDLQKITIGINLGFDLFRIIPGWRTKEKVPYASSDISFMMEYPTLHSIINFGKLLTGDKFEVIDSQKQIPRAREHFDKKEEEINAYFVLWLKSIEKLKKDYSLNIDLVIFQPYWAYDSNRENKSFKLNSLYEFRAKHIICKNLINTQLFDRIFYFDFSQSAPIADLFTFTYRHFKSLPKRIIQHSNVCADF